MLPSHPRRHSLVRRLIPGVLAISIATASGAQQGVIGTGGIKGLIRDSTGQALVGVQITIPGSSLVAETDFEGRFELAKIRPGMLSLRFRRLGFIPDTVNLLVLAGSVVPLHVPATNVH